MLYRFLQAAEERRKQEVKRQRLEAEARKRRRQHEREAELQAMKEAAAEARRKAAERAAARVAERPAKPYGHRRHKAPYQPRPARSLNCLQCGTLTRDWVHYAYPDAHPDGVCLCTVCHNAGIEFPYDSPAL